MRISEVLISGFFVGIMTRQCCGTATVNTGRSVGDTQDSRNYSGSTMSEIGIGVGGSGRSLSRKRRFIAFPLGSSFSVAVCMTIGVLGNPNYQYLSLGLNWGLAYELPNATWVLEHANGFGKKGETPEPVVKRRYRRELYQRLELIMDRMGYNGRDCILRALCESRQFFQSDKLGMIPELLRTVFSLPKTRLFTREIQENSEIEHYNRAYFSDEYEECDLKYPCSFSLLELAMGKYSQPESDYYGN